MYAGPAGVLYGLPIFPLDGAIAAQATRDLTRLIESHGFDAYVTLNVLDGKALEGVINVTFDLRDSQRTKQAHACIAALHDWCIEQGFPPYRLGNQFTAGVISKMRPRTIQTLQALKRVLDPNGILSPGKYQL